MGTIVPKLAGADAYHDDPRICGLAMQPRNPPKVPHHTPSSAVNGWCDAANLGESGHAGVDPGGIPQISGNEPTKDTPETFGHI